MKSEEQSLEDEVIQLAANAMQEEIDREIMEEVGWQILREENPDWHLVEIKWQKEHDSKYMWNEACAWAMETFGLPGTDYVTHLTKDSLKFLFKNEKDAILMTLKWI